MNKLSAINSTKKGLKKRRAILNAARRSFLQFGFNKTTMDDIAAEASISKPSLFYYFDSKENLFYESFIPVWRSELLSLIEKARVSEPVSNRIQSYVASSVTYYEQEVKKFGTNVAVLIEMEKQFGAILLPLVHPQIEQFMVDTIEQGIDEGVFTKQDPIRISELICQTERAFRAEAFKRAHLEKRASPDFKKLTADTVTVVNALLRILE